MTTFNIIHFQIRNGIWTGNVSLSTCEPYTSTNSTLQLVATVTDSNQESETVAIEYDPKGAELEIITSRPVITEDVKEAHFYVKVLSPLSPEAELVIESLCVSDSVAVNGKVDHPRFQQLDGYYSSKIDVDPLCSINVIKAFTKTNGKVDANSAELLAWPNLGHNNQLQFNWITPRKQHKFVYHDKEIFQFKVPHINDLNYAIVCENQVKDYGTLNGDKLAFEVTGPISGLCTVYVYSASATNNKVDMWTFYADTHECPQDTYSVAVSQSNIQVGENLNVQMKGEPQSLALLRLLDARLESSLQNNHHNKRHKMYYFSEFHRPESFSSQTSYLNGFLNVRTLFEEVKTLCHTAAMNVVTCDVQHHVGYSAISDSCLAGITYQCNKRGGIEQAPVRDGTEAAHPSEAPRILLAGPGWYRPATTTERVLTLQSAPSQDDPGTKQEEQQDSIRDFFPEVWLFEDYVMPESGEASLSLASPHSVTRFVLQSGFWTQKRFDMCTTPTHNIQIERKIYMNVDIPLHVYENETIQARITVSGDHTDSRQLSICFDFLSPIVCGDVGSNGILGEVEYSQITLHPGQSVIKSIFVKFLKVGEHKLTFKLVDNPTFSVGRWHCRDDELHVHDRIQINVKVSHRVDLDEHFRKVVLQKPIHPTLHLLDAVPRHMVDVIQFEKEFMDNGTMLADVKVQSNENIFNSEIELSEWEYSNVHPKPKKNRLRLLRRQRRDNSVSYGLSSVIKELSQLTYQRPRGNNEDDDYNKVVGDLLSELLTYSDCTSTLNGQICGFGEYGAPASPPQRDPLLSILATSLLCEQNAADQFVCGPMEYFADLASSDTQRKPESYINTMSFKNEKDRKDFLLALISWVGRDCKKYTCVNNSSAWKHIYSLRFDEVGQTYRDLRLDAALARVVTTSTSIIKKDRLVQKADLNELPFWTVNLNQDENDRSVDILQESAQKNANVLANSLGILAFIAKESDYNYWKNHLDFDKLSKWLVEQQNSNGQYDTPVSTYFGLRALYVYGKRQVGHRFVKHLVGNISVEGEKNGRTFNETDLPLALSLPTSAKNVQVASFGDSPLVLGVRVLTEKRKRSKRDPSDIYPVEIKMRQKRNPNNSFTQTVAITPHSALLKTIQIEHGFFTGFTSRREYLQTEGNQLASPVQFSLTAAHFALQNLEKDVPTVYNITVSEPENGYIPENLAPIAIIAKKNGVVGILVIGSEDVSFNEGVLAMDFRRKRHVYSIADNKVDYSAKQEDFRGQVVSESRSKREVRTLLESKSESSVVETVCLENGACTCAEVTCETECTNCSSTTVEQLCHEYNDRGFAVIFRIVNTRVEQRLGANYDVYDVKILEWYGNVTEPETFSIWLRECNTQCHVMTRQNAVKSRYLLIGNPEGIFFGSQSTDSSPELLKKHYLMRDGDRLARSMDCWSTFSQFQDTECVRA
ncbi:unnamed protein product [Bursaphelenchus okinawaensis]|uniref:NTR domain-containing protein n=1 Tax=Bursaphelenchus okinawaensis TaxID=465554 RepID=A0A811LQE7_9BILA|nr:unnamed protein product [Bursaphelenchus okinawaensis]CAG9127095.1 unnamed protein product [Bursaphelenchus okinawaensis]